MDCLFNLQIPPSSTRTVVVRPKGKTFITGVASSYDITFDEKRLGDYIKESEYAYLIGFLNDTIKSYWPCTASIWFGYILSPITLGLSFLIPNLCIKDAKVALISAIQRQNRIKLKEKGLIMKYVQGWSTSWL